MPILFSRRGAVALSLKSMIIDKMRVTSTSFLIAAFGVILFIFSLRLRASAGDNVLAFNFFKH
jgi:hypothetical protein